MKHTLVCCTAAVVLATLLSACGGGGSDASGPRTIKVTTTVGMVADSVRRVGGEHVTVTQLMGSGVDPHLYKASQGDIARLSGADVIFYNGLHLEGKMGEIMKKVGRTKPVVPVGETVPEEHLMTPPQFEGQHDPHIWFDVSLWAETLPAIVEELGKLDPEHAAVFEENARLYRDELLQLHDYCREQLATIPKERRVLITAHDAFGYFGRAYEVEVMGLQGISTAGEYGLQDVQRLAEVIAGRGIKAVFVESSVPKRSIEAVVEGCKARGHEVRIGGELFSDAMGKEDTPEGVYPGMVRHNVDTIVGALK